MAMQPSVDIPVNKLPKDRYGVMIDPGKASYRSLRVLFPQPNGAEVIRFSVLINEPIADAEPTVRLELMQRFPHGGPYLELLPHSGLYVRPDLRKISDKNWEFTVEAPTGLRWLVKYGPDYIAGGFHFNVKKYAWTM